MKRDYIGNLSRLDDVRASPPLISMPSRSGRRSKGWSHWSYETINANSLSSVMKKRLEDGEEIPECVKLFIQSRVSVTNPKGGEEMSKEVMVKRENNYRH